MSEDLFGGLVGAPPPGTGGSLAEADRPGLPLAVRMRPRTLDEIVGQQHLLAPGSPLRRLATGEPMSVFLWGPPGVGKTTIAAVVSRQTDSKFVELSAVTAGVKEVRAVLDQARRDLRTGRSTVLFVDEVHRFSKTQQDVLLPAVENRLVTLIAATTENPSFSVISPAAVALAVADPSAADRRGRVGADHPSPHRRPRSGRRVRPRRPGPGDDLAAGRRRCPPGAHLPGGGRGRGGGDASGLGRAGPDDHHHRHLGAGGRQGGHPLRPRR